MMKKKNVLNEEQNKILEEVQKKLENTMAYKLAYKSAAFKVNMDLFMDIHTKNEGNCLCRLNIKCPCMEFINSKICKCGVFYK